MAIGYKDIINYSLIRRLKGKMNDACILFNNLVRDANIRNRESEYYEVYTRQYANDMQSLKEIRNRMLAIADECNDIMYNMNVYNIKQYYLDKDELSEYEDFEDYKEQLPQEEEQHPVIEENVVVSEDDEW